MATTQTLSIVVPQQVADMIEAEIALGNVADASDYFLQLMHLDEDKLPEMNGEETADFEEWVRTEVVASCREMDEHPERGVSVEQMREILQERRRAVDLASK